MGAATNVQIDRVRGTDRIASLDVLRGIAILFILFMNMPAMGGYEFVLFDFRYPTWTTADYWTTMFTRTYLEGTQRGLLELLFGAGIMIMARRAMTPDGPVEVADLHYRRNLWLCMFGLANAFVLLLLRSMPSGSKIRWRMTMSQGLPVSRSSSMPEARNIWLL